jgi:hypothetical protein
MLPNKRQNVPSFLTFALVSKGKKKYERNSQRLFSFPVLSPAMQPGARNLKD